MIFFLMKNRRLSLQLFLGVLFLIGSKPSGSEAYNCRDCTAAAGCPIPITDPTPNECTSTEICHISGDAKDPTTDSIATSAGCKEKPTELQTVPGCTRTVDTFQCFCDGAGGDTCNEKVADFKIPDPPPPLKCYKCASVSICAGSLVAEACDAAEKFCSVKVTSATDSTVLESKCAATGGTKGAGKCEDPDDQDSGTVTCHCDTDGCNKSRANATGVDDPSIAPGSTPTGGSVSDVTGGGGDPETTTAGAGLAISNGKLVFALLMIPLLYYFGGMGAS